MVSKYYKRLKLELCQYGYTPSDFKFRLFSNQSPKVLANSIPKSGTNLLLRALYLFPSLHRKFYKTLDNRSTVINKVIGSIKKGEICSAHLKYTDEIFEALNNNNVRNIIIVRDPRDIAVSNAMYITYKDTRHRLSDYFINNLKSDNQRIMASIEGVPASELNDGVESLSLESHYNSYMRWNDNKDCLVIKFEELIGPNGGGTEQDQINCIHSIVNHIGLNTNDAEIRAVAKQVFNPTSRTFVKGQIGSWKAVMSDKHKEKIKSSVGHHLIELGYEEDDGW